MDPQIIAAIGIFLGVLTRTLLPYLKKLKDAASTTPPTPIAFDISFIYTGITALVISAAATLFLLPQYQIVAGQVPILVFGSAFTGGYTADSVLNNFIS